MFKNNPTQNHMVLLSLSSKLSPGIGSLSTELKWVTDNSNLVLTYNLPKKITQILENIS